MGIKFIPKPGQVLMCDFASNGFIRPEMQKVRHCVVVSPRYRRHTGCCIIVPFSTVVPDPVEPHHYKIPADKYSFFRPGEDTWAKADMTSHFSFDRLDRVLDHGRYASPSLQPEDFQGIQEAVIYALGMAHILNFPTVAEERIVEVVEITSEKEGII